MTSRTGALARIGAARAADRPFDVWILDWRMPGYDGTDVLRRARSDDARGVAPSILVTAHDEAEMWEAANDAGFRAVLVKPITPSALHDALVRVLRHSAPQTIVDAQSTAAEEALRRRHQGARVLFAEDNPVNQEVVLELLQSAGLSVDLAMDGEQALEFARARAYDLMLMDVQMPRLDGLQATRAIRALPAHAKTPILAMTANAFEEDRRLCLAAGMNDHVVKPVDPDKLLTTLLHWLPASAVVHVPASTVPPAVDGTSQAPPPKY